VCALPKDIPTGTNYLNEMVYRYLIKAVSISGYVSLASYYIDWLSFDLRCECDTYIFVRLSSVCLQQNLHDAIP